MPSQNNWVNTLSEDWVSQPSESPRAALHRSPSAPAVSTTAAASLSSILAATTQSSRELQNLPLGTGATPMGTTAVRRGSGQQPENWKQAVMEGVAKNNMFAPLQLESLFHPPSSLMGSPSPPRTRSEPSLPPRGDNENASPRRPHSRAVGLVSPGKSPQKSRLSEVSNQSPSRQQQQWKALPNPLQKIEEERSSSPRRMNYNHLPALPTNSPPKRPTSSHSQPNIPKLFRSESEPQPKLRPAKAPVRRAHSAVPEEVAAEAKGRRRPAMYADIENDGRSKIKMPEMETRMITKPRTGSFLSSRMSGRSGSEASSDRNDGYGSEREGRDELPEMLPLRPLKNSVMKFQQQQQESSVWPSSPPVFDGSYHYRSRQLEEDYGDLSSSKPTLGSPLEAPTKIPTPEASPALGEHPEFSHRNSYFPDPSPRRAALHGPRSPVKFQPTLQPSSRPPEPLSEGPDDPFYTPHPYRQNSDSYSLSSPDSVERSDANRRGSKSPMKLFQSSYDTYTSNKLDQRLEETEKSVRTSIEEDPMQQSILSHQSEYVESPVTMEEFNENSSYGESYSHGSSVVRNLEKQVRDEEDKQYNDQHPIGPRKRGQRDSGDLTKDSRLSSDPQLVSDKRNTLSGRKHRRWNSDETQASADGTATPKSPSRDRMPKRIRRSISGKREDDSDLLRNNQGQKRRIASNRSAKDVPRRRRTGGMTVEEGSILANSTRRSRHSSREFDEVAVALPTTPPMINSPRKQKRAYINNTSERGSPAMRPSPRKAQSATACSPARRPRGKSFITFSGSKGGPLQGAEFRMPTISKGPGAMASSPDEPNHTLSITTESFLARTDEVLQKVREHKERRDSYFEAVAAGQSFTRGMAQLAKNPQMRAITDTVGNRPRGSSFLETRLPSQNRLPYQQPYFITNGPPDDIDDDHPDGVEEDDDHHTNEYDDEHLTPPRNSDGSRPRGASVNSTSRGSVKTIGNTPEVLNHHLATKNNGMIFDAETRSWISKTPGKAEDDPFQSISDLSVDSKEEERALDLSRQQWVSQQSQGSTPGERSWVWRSSKMLQEVDNPDYGPSLSVASAGSSKTHETEDSQSHYELRPDTRATSYGTNGTHPSPKEGKLSPVDGKGEGFKKDMPRASPRGFDSSPTKRNTPSPELDGHLEHGSLQRAIPPLGFGDDDSSRIASLLSSQRKSSGKHYPSRPVSKIPEEPQMMRNSPLPRVPNGWPVHPIVDDLRRSVSTTGPITPRRPFSTPMHPPPSTTRRDISFHQTPLQDIKFAYIQLYETPMNPRMSGFDKSWMPSLHTSLNGKPMDDIADMTFSEAEKRVVKCLTDFGAYEPYWELMKELKLVDKDLETVHPLDAYCPNLENLDVSKNNLQQLSGVPIGVMELKVMRNCLSDATMFSHLIHLEFIDVSGNQLTSLAGLRGCRHLREIRADDNQITTLDGVREMEGLQKLRLRRNKMETLDFAGSTMNKLTDLDLRYNSLHTLSNLHLLPSLLNLNLDDNSLTHLTPSSPLPSLRTLKLTSNSITTLSLAPYPRLKTLFIDSNRITSLPHASHCQNLDAVSLRSQRPLQPWSQFQLLSLLKSLCDVRKLYLSGTTLRSIPQHIPRFLNLQYLELANTGLSTLPKAFAQTFPNLRVLNLNHNQISDTDFNQALECKRLAQFEAAGSGITHLPSGGKWGRSLKTLDLRNTPLTHGFYPPEASKFPTPGKSKEKVRRRRESLDEEGRRKAGMGWVGVGRKVGAGEAEVVEDGKAEEEERYVMDPWSLREWKEERQGREGLGEEVKRRREGYECVVGGGGRRVKVLDGRRWRE